MEFFIHRGIILPDNKSNVANEAPGIEADLGLAHAASACVFCCVAGLDPAEGVGVDGSCAGDDKGLASVVFCGLFGFGMPPRITGLL